MDVEIRHIISYIIIFGFLIVPTKQHTLESSKKSLETNLEPPRYSQTQGYGKVTDVEPFPNIRIYVYNPPDSFNPTSELFSKRTLKELETEQFKDQSQKTENEFSKMKESQKRQLATIMDAIERVSRTNRR